VALASLAAIAIGCRGDAPADVDEGSEQDLEAPAAEVAAPPLPDPSTPEGIVARLGPGVVSPELIGRCTPRPASTADLITRAARCVEAPGDAGCDAPITPGVVSIDDDGLMAIVSATWIEPCGGPTYLRVFEATPPWLRPDTYTTFAPGDGPIVKALSWIHRVTRRARPVDNVVRWACTLEAWTTPHERLALLGPPLDGWMLSVARGRRALPVRLVSPSNKRTHDLGVIDLGPTICDTEDGARDAVCEREVSASIEQAVLSASRRTLVVTARVGPTDQCAAERVVHTSFRLPEGVVSGLARPHEQGIQRRGKPAERSPE